jgi:hypothetical protein
MASGAFMKYIANKYGIVCSLLVLLLISTAGAASNEWTRAGTGLDAAVNVVQFQASRPDTLFAGAVNGFYRSGDGGLSWQPSGANLVDRSVLSLAVDPERATRLYAGLNTGLFTSADGGRQWQAVADIGAGVLVASAGADGRVYAGTFGQGVYVSLDRGSTWNMAGSELQADIVFALAAHPLEAATVYAGTARGLFVSRDSGVNWQSVAALEGLSVRSIALPSTSSAPELVLVATFGGGVYVSEDSGLNWQASNSGLDDLNVRAVAVDPDVPQLLYAATSTSGFYRSKDGGISWTSSNEGLQNLAARWVGVVPGDNKRVLGSTSGVGAFEIDFTPEAHIRFSDKELSFGSVAVNATSERTLDISNDGEVDLIISNINVERTGDFSVSPTSLTVKKGETSSVRISFNPQARGATVVAMTVRSNDLDQSNAEIVLRGTGVQAQLSAQPSVLQFGEVAVGAFVDTNIVLSNAGNATLSLRNAFFEDSAFRLLSSLPAELAPGQSSTLKVRFVPLIARGISSLLVVVGGDGSNAEIGVDGVGTSADINLSSTALDFGTVDLASARVLELGVSNSGNATLLITDLGLVGDAFRMDSVAPLSIEPGEQKNITLRFFPLAAGDHSGVLTIETDVPGRLASTQVALSGAGGALALRAQSPQMAGSGPADLIVADFNGDGAPDLAIADSAGGQVRVHYNDGSGDFTDAAIFPSEVSTYSDWDQPAFLATASIYGAEIDLVVGDPVERSISILANSGGRFDSERHTIYIGHTIADVLAVDLDADGDADIATANWDDASVTILFNNGRGTFNARTALAVDPGPVALAAGYLNADDHRDLVVANSLAGTVSVLFSNREGGFQTRQDIVVGIEPVAVTIIDVDADGDNDLLVGNRGSRDVAVLINDGDGGLTLSERVRIDLPVAHMDLSDMTRDIFSDLVVASPSGSYIAFLENDAGAGFVTRDIIASQAPLSRVVIADLNGDGANDIAALSSSMAQVQVFLNEDARLGDPPRPPTGVEARDMGRDLGRQVEVVWQAPELDEQLLRTTRYTIFRSPTRDGTFSSVDTLLTGIRSFVDPAATLADTFYYYVVAGNASVESAPSDTVWAVSKPSPFFELEVVNESRFSIGDTLIVRAYIVPTAHVLTGISLYMTYDAVGLDLVDAGTDSTVTAESENLLSVQPFQVADAFVGRAIENKLHGGALGRLDLSLVQSMGTPLVGAGVDPVLLGVLRFVTRSDAVAQIRIDDEPALNRSSAVVDDGGQWIPPFIPERPTEITIRDFSVQGQVALQGRQGSNASSQISLFFYDSDGQLLSSPTNDEDRLSPGIQYTLDANGLFELAQMPQGTYQILVKSLTHLQGHVLGGQVEVNAALGDTLLGFEWVVTDTSQSLPAGDANDDNRINLADFGLLVDHFNSSVSADREARQADFDGDGLVDLDDFMLLAENFGRVGMELGTAAAAKRAPASFLLQASDEGVLSIDATEEITGFTLLLSGVKNADWAIDGTLWSGRDIRLEQWPEAGALRVVAALADPQSPLLAAGVLALLPAGAQVVEAEVLRADGQLVTLRMGLQDILPAQSALLPNFPNPFNPETTIPFAIGAGDHTRVELAIFNALGQRVRTLFAGSLTAGLHRIQWDGRSDAGHEVATGAYIYRLEVGQHVETRRLLLLR